MNDRTRRNHQRTRRNLPPSSSAQASNNYRHNNTHSHYSGNHSSRLHGHHGHRSIYRHGHSLEAYSPTSIGRHQSHPSTSSNLVSSSSRSSRSQYSYSISHSRSICYSYLIAMFCSVLVALGIYLALTRFNLRYLYISLVGILIEAVGACIYCICNIRASRLARQKPRLSVEEFILDTSGNIRNNGLASNESITIDNTQRQQTNHQQQSPSNITHILDNMTFNSNGSNHNDNDNSSSANVVNSTAINSNNNSNSGTNDNQNSPQPATATNNDLANQTSTNISPVNSIVVIPDESHGDQTDSLLSANSASLTIPADQLPSTSASTNLSPDLRQLQQQPSGADGTTTKQSDNDKINPPSQLSVNLASQFTGRLGDDKSKRPSESQPAIPSPESPPDQPIVQHDLQTITRSTIVNDETSELIPRAQERRPRKPAHFRRTLVMGLSGEEEVIEIDEDDLDNMSILPPPYESIATSSTGPLSATSTSTTTPATALSSIVISLGGLNPTDPNTTGGTQDGQSSAPGS